MTAYDGDDLGRVSRWFKQRTGLGTDRFHPRTLQHISAAGRHRMAAFILALESATAMPSHAAYICYHLIPKLSGGLRTIGVFSGLFRCWEALRCEGFKVWMQKHERSYDWARSGRSPEAAVWRQLLCIEGLDPGADQLSDPACVTVLLDIVKCFERLTLAQVWFWGLKAGLPRRFLLMVMKGFSVARFLVVSGCCSDSVRVFGAIVAGSRFSVGLLHLVLMGPCDYIAERWTFMLTITKFVDDITLLLNSTGNHIVSSLPVMLAAFLTAIRELGLDPSVDEEGKKGKTVALASSCRLRRVLGPVLADFGIHMDGSARNLGVQHEAAGPATGGSVPAARVKAVGRRHQRLMGTGAPGHRKRLVFATGLKPAAIFGCKAVGLRKPFVEKIRRMASACLPGSHRGCSTTLRLAVHRAEVRASLSAPPVVAWAAEVWDAEVPAKHLEAAWRRQMPRIFLFEGCTAAGPAASVSLALRLADWAWPAPTVFRTAAGVMLDLREYCPRDVQAQYEYDVENKMWKDWVAANPQLAAAGPRPLIEPLAAFAKGRPSSGRLLAISQVVRGAPCQAALCEAGSTSEPWCLLCGQRGTVVHRCYACPATKAERDEAPRAIQHLGETAAEGSTLYTRALLKDPASEWAFRSFPEVVRSERAKGDEDWPLTGLAAMDGSLKWKYRGGGALGWGLALTDGGGELLQRWYGTVPCTLPVQVRILRAELYAFLMLLRLAAPPVHGLTDCEAVRRGLAAGKRHTTSSRSPHADIWRLIWVLVDDMGISDGGIALDKVKAHMSAAKIAGLMPEARAWALANKEADEAAKLGGEFLAMEAARGQAVGAAAASVREVLSFWASFLPAAMGPDGWRDCDHWDDLVTEVKTRVPRPRHTLELEYDRGAVRGRCTVCHKVARTFGGVVRLRAEPCRGAATARLPVNPDAVGFVTRGHTICTSRSGYLFCSRCGAHTRERLAALKRVCLGRPQTPLYRNILRRLVAGYEPSGYVWYGGARRVLAAEAADPRSAAGRIAG